MAWIVEGAPIPAPIRIRAVFLDVGETIIDETPYFEAWADWLGVPRHTFSAVVGGVIASGGDLLDAFQHFQPRFDLARPTAGRLASTWGWELSSNPVASVVSRQGRWPRDPA